MINLQRCTDDAMTHFEAIASSKEESRCMRLLAMKQEVAAATVEYVIASPELQILSPLQVSKQQHDDLLHCYESETKALSELKARIRASQSELFYAECQYCCLGVPRTFDHYLPKRQFPEFAVFLENLLPCCGDCNNLRGEVWRDAQGERKHLHLYFDVIDQSHDVLFADIHMAKLPFASFRLDLSGVGTQPFFQLLERHFDALQLLARYKVQAQARLNEHHRTIHEFGKVLRLSKIVRILQAQFTQDKKDRGPHDWRVALLRAVIASPAFVQFALDNSPSVWTQ